ncbi:MAG: hypothetical protein H8E44_10925 [Planctomycetes bacterium]|nr:hypothetical protein [Planctomycetota bacterium]MBL7042502.1 hypothetical protein [Pirellulaceae bacterium]
MEIRDLSAEDGKLLEQVLGYLNFSSGAADPRFLAGLNRVFELTEGSDDQPAWHAAIELLGQELHRLNEQSNVFKDAGQAAAVLQLLREHVLPAYLEWHRDLLFHQDERSLFNSFFVGRVCEAILSKGPPWDEHERFVGEAIGRLNDYIGHRPVAALESQKIEPYAHEWVRPLPLYIRDAGVAVGRYRKVVEATIELLNQTDEDILREACFDPELLDELAVDPRAYDFDHPANKRPNYHFGQWDPHSIDNRGFYRRYVVQQITLDSLMSRLDSSEDLPGDELLLEAAAVMAGTIIMSTGISGAGPDTHDSTVTLANLLPRIAGYRDAFYERLLSRIGGRHGKRLRVEVEKRRQPFGGARQHLNAALARHRAAQLEHVHLAAIFARMGHPEAATQQANIVPAASARMLCQIDCCLTDGDQAVAAGELERTASLLEEIMDWLRRGIECGAIVDPWNMLGFDANFSLFPALENSIRDHRADDLVALMDQIFGIYSRVWSEAAARDDQPLCRRMAEQFRETASWWRKYAAHEVSSLDAVDVEDAYNAAELVAHALNLWYKGGAAVEDVRFWAPHANMFDSPKAYGLVVCVLLERGDFVASMALLMHWLGQAPQIGLEKGDTSFCHLAEKWMLDLREKHRDGGSQSGQRDAWELVCKFMDRLEANAEEYWDPPRFEMGESRGPQESSREEELLEGQPDEDDEEQKEELYEAAYEGMVYRDSTDDGVDSELFDYGQPSDDELMGESKRLGERLSFTSTVAQLWQLAVTIPKPPNGDDPHRLEIVHRWIDQAAENRGRLRGLLDAIDAFELPTPTGDHDSMVEYDRVRLIKESIVETIIAASVDTADASRILSAVAHDGKTDIVRDSGASRWSLEESLAITVSSAVLRGDAEAVRKHWDDFVDSLMELPLLYVPPTKGGDPHKIVTARVRQRAMQDLLAWLPRRGLIRESCQLIETAREMERLHPVGAGAVTEFDELFKIGYKALVRMAIHSAPSWGSDGTSSRADESGQAVLVECLKQLTESLLSSWLAHSKTLRLSVLEKVKDKRRWGRLVNFVERYGADIFTQRFLNLANLRAILYEGVDEWLDQLEEEAPVEIDWRLLDDLEVGRVDRDEAVEYLSLILEAVVENYGEYRDYNSMTTQSDSGELLYTLLDFLRLRTEYDRICWQLKPVIWAHELLVRHEQHAAAEMWRGELAEQTSQQASKFLEKLAKLQNKYAMRMPTVADRLGERFVRPMAIDRIRALVGPAMHEAGQDGPCPSFEALQRETDELTRQPTGVGLDVPAWLVALQEEMGVASDLDHANDQSTELDAIIPQKTLSLEETQQQLKAWSSKNRK